MREDAWLSEQLGKDVFILENEMTIDLTPGRLYVKKTANVREANILASVRDFFLVSVDVELERFDHYARENMAYCAFNEGEPGKILDIAEKCFIHDRFHQDPHIPDGVAGKIKRAWMKNCLDGGRGNRVFSLPDGFLCAMLQGDYAVIDLIGVDPAKQGLGIGSVLVDMFLWYYQGLKYRVGTQLANIPSLRLYARKGFWIAGYKYVLHRHT